MKYYKEFWELVEKSFVILGSKNAKQERIRLEKISKNGDELIYHFEPIHLASLVLGIVDLTQNQKDQYEEAKDDLWLNLPLTQKEIKAVNNIDLNKLEEF